MLLYFVRLLCPVVLLPSSPLHSLFADGRQQCDVTQKLSSDRVFTPEDIEMWLARMPLVVHLMELAFHYCFPVSSSDTKLKILLNEM